MVPITKYMQNTLYKKLIGIAIIVIAIIAVLYYNYRPSTQKSGRADADGWKTYERKDFGFSFRYPASWGLNDGLSRTQCCIFLNNYVEKPSASSTATTTTTILTSLVKVQFGYYDVAIFDPFKEASSSLITIGNNAFYYGLAKGTPFYILPRSATEGLGIAVFYAPEATSSAEETMNKILSSVKITPIK